MRFPWTTGAFTGTYAIACAAVVLQLLHAASLLCFARPLPSSNLLQLLLPLLLVAGCLLKRAALEDAQDRRTWTLFTVAFSLWSLAELCYLVELRYASQGALSSVDDILWLLFAVPLLLVVSGSLEGRLNWISWLDQGQAFVFFLVVAMLVYAHPPVLSFNTAYAVQNIALLLSCTLRFSAAETRKERAFFRRFALYLVIYFVCASIGNELARRGWPPGSLVDLLWTLPLTAFCVLLLTPRADRRAEPLETPLVADELTRYLHDLSALGLAALAMGSSVFLVLHWTLPGFLCLAVSFVVFSIRTCGRERELHQTNKKLQGSVLEDALTGLGNRACLRQTLTRLLDRRAPASLQNHTVAVLFVDLDGFKAINDSLGHEAGDKVLVEIAHRIKAACPGGGIACRLGGDEFVVLLQGEPARNAPRLASAILAAIRAPLQFGHETLQLSGSLGVAVTGARDEPDILLRRADHAMYRAKRLGKNRVEIADNTLPSTPGTRRMLEDDLRDCLQHQQLGVALQPIYSLQHNAICGFEALARWSHPRLGPIPPAEFLPLAEETGLIFDLGLQVLTRACREVARCNATRNTRFTLSINLSARQFTDPNLLPSILDVLASTPFDPHLLHLEITETVLLAGEAEIAGILIEAQRHGMQISLDDFGTGYSSLSHLLTFPTDEIKIDQRCIHGLHQDPRRADLVRTVLQLGRTLGKRVVVEGVEALEELQVLQDMGCQFVQGHLLAAPIPADTLHDHPLWRDLDDGQREAPAALAGLQLPAPA